MTQTGYRHRIVVQDRSWSMNNILAGAQSGLEEFLASEEQVDGKLTVSLWEFDAEIRCVHSFATVSRVKRYKIQPHGMTAMYDAIGRAVSEDGASLAALPEDERPEDVVVVINSDGEENSSKEFTGSAVKALLDQQQSVYGWRVIYMGTNQDALEEGEKIGTQAGLTTRYVNTSTGAANNWRAAANYLSRTPVASVALAGGQSISYSAAERDLAESGEDGQDN